MISHLFLWWHWDRSSCRSPMLDSVIAAANHDVDVTTNDVEIPTFRSTTDSRSENVDESTTGSTSGLTQISWTVSLIINGLYFINYLKFLLVCWIWEYSKTKIGHNFLPGLARRNLNTDLSLSVLRKKISKWTLMLS